MSIFSASGRSGRLGWWGCQLLLGFGWLLIFLTTGVLVGADSDSNQAVAAQWGWGQVLLFLGLVLAMVWVNVSACIRRYHDRGKAWSWFFVGLIPIVGPVWQMVELGFFPGQSYDNEYGPARRGGGSAFNQAVAEVGDNHWSKDAFQERAQNSGVNTVDATTSALRENERRHQPVAGAAPAAFGRRGA